MDLAKKLKETMPDLHSAQVSEKELFNKGIDFSRPLNDYPKADFISKFLLENGNQRQHIYTKDLNVNGVAVQDAMEKYLDHEAYQSSNFKQALLSPLHLEHSLGDDKAELEKLKGKKPYFELGNYLHECILEPTKFGRAIVEPKYSLTSKEGVKSGIEFWENQIEQQGHGVNEIGETLTVNETFALALKDVEQLGLNLDKQDGKKAYLKALKAFSGMEAVSEEHYLKIQILKRHFDNYGGGILKELLPYSKREISFYLNHESGLKVKVRPDAIQFKENIGVDAIISIKSTAMEDLRGFCYDAAKKHYDLSEGMYQEVVSEVTGRDFNTTIMIMLQTVPPFGIAVLIWSAEDIETGKYKFHEALNIAAECKESGIYKGYEAFAEENTFGLIQMQLPEWNQKQFLPTN